MAEQIQTRAEKPHLDSGVVGRIAHRLGENGNLRKFRRAGLRAYAKAVLPDRVNHIWRYTDPAIVLPDMHLDDHALWPQAPQTPPPAAETSSNGLRILLRAGAPPDFDLTAEAQAQSVEIAPLGTTETARERIGSVVPATHGILESLNTAIWSAGVQILIPAGVRFEEPLRIVSDCAARVNTPRILVVLEKGAEAVIIEEHTGGDAGRSVVGVTELLVGEGASAHYLLYPRMHTGVTGHLTLHARVERNANVRLIPITLGTSCTKLDLGSTLCGRGANSEVIGLALAGNRQHVDHHTVQHHRAANTRSRVRFKTALNGRAHSAYTGLIRIEEAATDCEAYQENRNLLLSARSRADSIPELEILNQDVQCSHGATVSPVDEEHVFYMQSRGITRAEATRLIVRGFIEDILSAIPESLRGEMEGLLRDRMVNQAATHTRSTT